ncbi:hypothetical protein CHS0354_009160 [Potamilus streckersoni]|uniref:Mab-21-like nucleotidyltransferase domain-containing protein n=1 Tax=Potamilus streckersoni TaxID=2493646 RepID=A0AAE0VKY0_9BIVA|nr:hypothetical protein CHS0354_009160 [Potamilus streckersoni]
MTHQVPEHYCSVSERLSNILDNVGYSREDRDRTVTNATEFEVFSNMASALVRTPRVYIFGSRGEGSTGPGLQSDRDILYQDNMRTVITDLSQCQPEITNFLMVKDTHTHPGYAKIQPIIISPDYNQEVYSDVHITTESLNRCALSNTKHQYFGTESGPAYHQHHERKEFSVDRVHASRCSQWPQEGYEWFLRRRLNGWPTPIQIENARKYGCFVTTVGHPYSPECHLEWRLSFSIAERDITRSFEDTTMKVYILLKMIRKTYIELVVGDTFSSYHCKVCMIWMRERTPHELWRNEHLLQCLVLCIIQLYEWSATGFYPDYFIVTNNINAERLSEQNRYNTEELLQTQTSFCIIYLPSEISITPKPLRMEMFRSIGAPSELRKEHFDSWFDWGVVDSVVCLYFFLYLNFSRQGNDRHKEVAMYNMIHGFIHINSSDV